MNSTFYFDSLLQYDDLKDELDDLYNKATNLEEFKNVMFCGDDVLIGDEKGTPAVRKFETYGDAIGKVNEIVFKFEEATHLNKENKIGQIGRAHV